MTHHNEQHEHATETATPSPQQHEAVQATAAEMRDAHLPAPSPNDNSPTNVLGMVDQVEEQLRHLREAQRAQDEELARLNERFSRLEQAESDLAEQRAAFQEQQQSLAVERHAVEEQRRALDDAREQWDKSIEGREADLNRHNEKLKNRETDFAKRDAQIAQRECELDHRRNEINERERHLHERNEQSNEEREELLRRVDQAEQNVGELIEQIETLQKTIDERDAQLQSNAARQESLEAELESVRQHAQPLAQQRDALHTEKSALEQQLHELRSKHDRTQHELELLRNDHEQSTRQRTGLEAQQREYQAQIERLRQKLTERDERVAEYEAQIEQIRSDNASASTADQAVLQSLRNRVEELEQQLEEARTIASASDETNHQLQEKAKRIDEVARHVHRRQARLKKMRTLLRQRREAKQRQSDQREVHAAELRAIEKQTQRLNEMKASLAESERKMVQRWARPRAVVMVGWAILLVVANVVASWLLASQIAPPERTAWVTLAPETQSGEPLSSDRIDSWQQWHVATLNDDGFHRTLARRFAERGIEIEGENAVSEIITERTGVDFNRNGSFTLTLAGNDRHVLVPMLDVIATTLASESRRRAGTRTDSAWAVIRGEQQVGGQLQYATLNPWTNNDRRFIWMSPLFALTVGISCALIWLVYRRLILAKRVFEEQCRVA